MKVLNIEDEKVSLEKLTYDLNDIGAEKIQTFTKGVEALDHLSYNKYDLILVDLKLPDIDGVQLIKRIRQQVLVTKIVIISGNINKEIFGNCSGLGIEDILCKPYNKEKLARHVA